MDITLNASRASHFVVDGTDIIGLYCMRGTIKEGLSPSIFRLKMTWIREIYNAAFDAFGNNRQMTRVPLGCHRQTLDGPLG